MPYEALIKTGKIKPYTARPSEIKQLFEVATRDLNAASRNLNEDADWAYTIAYNAVLQACRALILYEGYRPRGGEQHATVVDFIKEQLGSPFAKEVALVDQMRRKRHRVIYEVAGLVSKQEATQAVEFATRFVEQLKQEVSGQQNLGV